MMTPQEQNIAVAQSLGWKCVDGFSINQSQYGWYLDDRLNPCHIQSLPNYHGCLNACAEMEDALIDQKNRRVYCSNLWDITGCSNFDADEDWQLSHATAPQRVEAHLRTRGLWRD